jgi:hypothetical protein
MGVKFFTDYFQRAKEYDLSWKAFNASNKKEKTPRVDIELQILAKYY